MILAFFRRPYPYLGHLQKDVLGNVLIGLFVALFLIVFQPFDTNIWITDHKMLKLAGFGLISFLIPTLANLIMRYLLPERLKEEQWTVGAEISAILVVLICIALGNMLYGFVLGVVSLTFKNYLVALSITLVVGIFPVTFHVVRKHNKMLSLSLAQVRQLNDALQLNQQAVPPAAKKGKAESRAKENTIRLLAENERDIFTIPMTQLLFIESADNYAVIVYVEERLRKKQLLRSSLKRVEGQLQHPDVIRCHRAYIVNLANVRQVKGNAAGYRLHFDTGDQVPVSRNFVPAVASRIRV